MYRRGSSLLIPVAKTKQVQFKMCGCRRTKQDGVCTTEPVKHCERCSVPTLLISRLCRSAIYQKGKTKLKKSKCSSIPVSLIASDQEVGHREEGGTELVGDSCLTVH